MAADRRMVEIAPGHHVGCRRVAGAVPSRPGFVRVCTSSHRPPFELSIERWDAAAATEGTHHG